MNMPGFTAEASLYETRESYCGVGAGANPATGVMPAFDGAHQLAWFPSCWQYRAYVCDLSASGRI